MVNWRHLVRVGERAALPNFGRCTSCVSGCVAAAAASCELRLSNFNRAAAAANFRVCQILKELRQLQNFTMRSSCVWRGELPHSICSIWANENYELDTRSEKNISKCVRFELFEVLSMFLFSRTKLGPLNFISKFWDRRNFDFFLNFSYNIYRKWGKKNERKKNCLHCRKGR